MINQIYIQIIYNTIYTVISIIFILCRWFCSVKIKNLIHAGQRYLFLKYCNTIFIII